jgi:hypothetical protein
MRVPRPLGFIIMSHGNPMALGTSFRGGVVALEVRCMRGDDLFGAERVGFCAENLTKNSSKPRCFVGSVKAETGRTGGGGLPSGEVAGMSSQEFDQWAFH